MTIKSAVSTNLDPKQCAAELRQGVGDLQPTFVLFFCTSNIDADQLGAALSEQFPNTASIGCTTAGELGQGRVLKNAVTLMAMDANAIKSAHVAVVDDPTDKESTVKALSKLADASGCASSELDPKTHVGLVLHDGLQGAEEAVMRHLTEQTNVAFVGGSAGDDLKFQRTLVFENFRPVPESSVLALLEPTHGFQILKTQSFEITDKVLEVTELGEQPRCVKSFNGKPAAREYADQLGVSLEQLPTLFGNHPLGLVLQNGEPFVRSPQQLADDDQVKFYCQVSEGMKLHLLNARSYIQDTNDQLKAKIAQMNACQGIINFHCILRTLQLPEEELTAYGKVFSDYPTVGFSTYGESYIGHINQTSTIVLLG